MIGIYAGKRRNNWMGVVRITMALGNKFGNGDATDSSTEKELMEEQMKMLSTDNASPKHRNGVHGTSVGRARSEIQLDYHLVS